MQASTTNLEQRPLRVGTVAHFLNNTLLPYFDLKKNRSIKTQIYGGFSYVVHQNVTRGHFDFGFIAWTEKPKAVRSIKIKKDPLAVVGLKTKFPALRKAKNMKDLEALPIIWLPKLHRDPNIYFPLNKKSYVVQSYDNFKHLILNGYGIGEVQLDFFSKAEQRMLAHAPFPAPRDGVHIYLIYREDAPPFIQEKIETIAADMKAKFN